MTAYTMGLNCQFATGGPPMRKTLYAATLSRSYLNDLDPDPVRRAGCSGETSDGSESQVDALPSFLRHQIPA